MKQPHATSYLLSIALFALLRSQAWHTSFSKPVNHSTLRRGSTLVFHTAYINGQRILDISPFLCPKQRSVQESSGSRLLPSVIMFRSTSELHHFCKLLKAKLKIIYFQQAWLYLIRLRFDHFPTVILYSYTSSRNNN